jgi:hypothetical protein
MSSSLTKSHNYSHFKRWWIWVFVNIFCNSRFQCEKHIELFFTTSWVFRNHFHGFQQVLENKFKSLIDLFSIVAQNIQQAIDYYLNFYIDEKIYKIHMNMLNTFLCCLKIWSLCFEALQWLIYLAIYILIKLIWFCWSSVFELKSEWSKMMAICHLQHNNTIMPISAILQKLHHIFIAFLFDPLMCNHCG